MGVQAWQSFTTNLHIHGWRFLGVVVVSTFRGWFYSLIMDSPRISFHEWFRAQLAQRGLSQDQAAKLLHVPFNTINRWATGKNLPEYKHLIRMNELFGELPQELRPPDTPDLQQHP